jgi:peptide/nickel transport system substrate-binding protein
LISSIGAGTADMVYEKLVTADWAKGPAGTNEFNFGVPWVAPQYQTGQISESWEIVNLSTMVLRIRQGMRFQSKAPANGKELTANDVVYSYQRGQKDTRFVFYGFVEWTNTAGLDKARVDAKTAGRTDAEFDAWVVYLKSVNYPFYAPKSCVAKDKWTVEYRMLNPNKPIFEDAAWFFVESSEGAAYDMQNWKNACGTGPWIVSDVVADSSVTWIKNPNYWMKDPVHPGKQLPYLDGLVGVVIPDAKIAQSALRTHKIDFMTVDWDVAIQMTGSNPELSSKKIAPTGAYVMFMRTDIAPFNDVRVRQAIAMGIDRDAVVRDYYKGNAFVDAWPVLPGLPGYTPREKMPPDVRQLYEYHPDLSKKLLAEAGFPNGITFDCQIGAPYVVDIEHLTLLAEQWKTAGITVNIAPIEPGLGTTLVFTFAYKNSVYTWWGNSAPADAMLYANGGGPDIYNFSHARDPLAVQAMSAYAKMTNQTEAYEFLRQEYLRTNKLVWQVPLPTRSAVILWQPYLKGFRGEVSMGPSVQLGGSSRVKFFWIDQKIKASYK